MPPAEILTTRVPDSDQGDARASVDLARARITINCKATKPARIEREVVAMKKSYIFRVIVEEDLLENGRQAYHAYCPALKGCHTWGHTSTEALANIREAVELYIEDLLQTGAAIPWTRTRARWSGPLLPWQ